MQDRPKNLLKVVMIGDPEVGKTSIVNQLTNNQFIRDYKPSLGPDFFVIEIFVGKEKYTLQLWDTEGIQRFQYIGPTFFRETACCMLVYDITNPISLKNLEERREEFLYNNQKNPENYPFVLIGNKLDREGERKVTPAQAQAWCEKYNIKHYFEVSAKENIMIEEAIQVIAETAKDYLHENEEKPLPEMNDLNLNNKNQKPKFSSCLC